MWQFIINTSALIWVLHVRVFPVLQDQRRTNALHAVVRIQSYPSAEIFLHGQLYILLAQSGITNQLQRLQLKANSPKIPSNIIEIAELSSPAREMCKSPTTAIRPEPKWVRVSNEQLWVTLVWRAVLFLCTGNEGERFKVRFGSCTWNCASWCRTSSMHHPPVAGSCTCHASKR